MTQTFQPMLAILRRAGIGKRRRWRIVQRCSHFARVALADGMVQATDQGRYLFHVGAAMEWLAGDGERLTADPIRW